MLNQKLSESNILVTGGAGFIGANFVKMMSLNKHCKKVYSIGFISPGHNFKVMNTK